MQTTAIFALLFFLSSLCCQAQGHVKKERRMEERGISSFVELFTKLEHDWAIAIQKQDKATLDKLLAPEFLVRRAADAEHTILRSDWLEKVVPAYKIDSFRQSGMAVRVFPGDIALVSFVQSQQATLGGVNESGQFLVVDVWVGNRERRQWEAAQRYWAPVPQQ